MSNVVRGGRAGWASTDITPPLGLPMGGRGPRFAPGTEVLDPLQAQALVLEDGEGRRVVWLSVEVVNLPESFCADVRFAIAAATAASPDAVCINCSHTHSGPMTHHAGYATLAPAVPEVLTYLEILRNRMVSLAVQAMDTLRPVRVTWREGSSDIGINRRLPTDQGVTMGPNEQGAYHRQLWVLELAAAEGSARRAIVFSHGCHPVIVYGFAWQSISADWPGRARRSLSETLGEDVHCQFMQGLAGNIRPRILADLDQHRFRSSRPEDVDAVGQQIATDVLRTLDQPGQELTLNLGAAEHWFLARREPPAPIEHWRRLAESDNDRQREIGRYWVHRLSDGPPPCRAQPWPVGLIRLDDDHFVAHLPGEPVAEWIDVLRQALPDRRFAAWGYTQHSLGYLPTDALLPEGGYEVAGSSPYLSFGPAPFAPGLDRAVQTAFQSLLNRLS